MNSGCDSPRASSIEIDRLEVRYPRAAAAILEDIGLRLDPGESVGLLGRSGCGKTTLLHVAAGLVPWLTPAAVAGDVAIGGESVMELDPSQRAPLVSTCLDRPEAQLFLATVRQEIAAARERSPGPILERAVDGLGLGPLLDRRVTELSSGERQRVSLAVTLAGCPRPMLLDEPTAHLDTDGEGALVELLQQAGLAGSAILLAEQTGWKVSSALDRWGRVVRGTVIPAPAPLVPQVTAPLHEPGDTVVCTCRGIAVNRGGRQLLRGLDLELREGEIVAVAGPNGCGKSTFASVVAGRRPADAGSVATSGRVALMLPEADLQLFASTVGAEVASAGATHEESARVLRRHRLDHLAARAPWTLSRGEQQRLVHAALDLLRPRVMIVDEPGQGLDGDDLRAFLDLVHRRAAKGRAYLVFSHRPEIGQAAHRRLEIIEGRIEQVAP